MMRLHASLLFQFKGESFNQLDDLALMNVALWLVLLMLGTQLGAALSQATQHWCVVLVGLAAAVLLICRQFSLSRWKLFVLVVVLGGLFLRSLTGQAATRSASVCAKRFRSDAAGD
jgi:hypothetical protein